MYSLASTQLIFPLLQTGFTLDRSDPKYDYRLRRQALRDTWFPSSQAALDRLEASTGVIVRFVIGHSPNAAAEAEVAAEEEAHGGFLRLPLEESYLNLTNKTLTFFKTVVRQYDPQYIIKVDDDVYLRVDRVPAAVAQWRDEQRADYIGCMKTGPIYTTKNFRWYEPQHAVLGSQSYFTHCWGSIYVLSGRAAQMLASVEPSLLRFFANEDVTVGSWMLAMQVQHFDDRRLCETKCSATSLAVFDFPQCAGLCDAAKRLPELHAMKECHSSSNENGEVPMLPSIINFSVELPT